MCCICTGQLGLRYEFVVETVPDAEAATSDASRKTFGASGLSTIAIDTSLRTFVASYEQSVREQGGWLLTGTPLVFGT